MQVPRATETKTLSQNNYDQRVAAGDMDFSLGVVHNSAASF